MTVSKKITLAGLLVALGVVLSGLHIPIGVAKVFPIQHMINLISAVLLGPTYAVLMAFATSAIRVSTGMGSLLAFPGSMIGAFLAGILYQKRRSVFAAFAGEVIGTGILGALVAYPVAAWLLSKEVAVFTFVVPFSISSVTGAVLGLIGVFSLQKTGILRVERREEA